MSDNAFSLLIVDDNPDNRDVLAARLGRLGYRNITMAADGAEALEVLAARSFDLVLLDIMMPKLNGYQVLERLRGEGRLADLPVIVVSALDEMESVVRCIELGAEDYLTKPINATLLKARVGACLEKKRLRDQALAYLAQLERELAAAREVQLSMVPTRFPEPTPDMPVDVFARLEPARQVGGDLYDVFAAAGALYVAVADVSDKGAAAALFMARTKTLLRLLATPATGTAPDPADVLAAANVELCRDNPHGMFVTVVLVRLTDQGGTITVCNAGHGAPYLLHPGAGATPLPGPRDKPLGIRPGFAYRNTTHALDAGDGLFLYTDGITEAMDPAGELFSDERLEAALAPLVAADPAAVVDGVIARVREFAADAPPSDDIAVLAVRRRNARAHAVELVIPARPAEAAQVTRALDELAAAAAVSRDVVSDMHVALDEILTNAITHGQAREIRVRLSVSPSALAAEVEDDGIPFDPLSVPPPDLDVSLQDRRVGGLGIHFVRRLMTRVEYARLDNRNRLVLERTLAERKEESRGAP